MLSSPYRKLLKPKDQLYNICITNFSLGNGTPLKTIQVYSAPIPSVHNCGLFLLSAKCINLKNLQMSYLCLYCINLMAPKSFSYKKFYRNQGPYFYTISALKTVKKYHLSTLFFPVLCIFCN